MTAGPITLIALEADQAATAAIRESVMEGIAVLGVVADVAALVAAAGERRPAAILLDLGAAGADPVAAVRSVVSAAPETCVIVTGGDVSPALISRAVSAGARGFILRPFRSEELAATLRDTLTNHAALRRLQRGETEAVARRGKVISVYSPKGGVGCTTIATNLAVALAGRVPGRVGLVDLDLQFGDVGVALDLRSANSIIDLVAHDGDLSEGLVDEVFIRHDSNVRVLVSPEHVDSTERLDPDAIIRAVDGLREHFAFVVCDLWSSLDELSLGILRVSDHILLVTTPEIPALKNIRRATVATPLLNDGRTRIVLNRHPGKAGVSIGDVEKNLGRRVAATVPSEGIGVTEAINQGISLFDSRAHVRARRSYARLADSLLQDGQKPAADAVTLART